MRLYIGLFVLMTVWDWATAVSVRYIAAENLAAVPAAMVLGLFWWAAVTSLKRNWQTALATCAGASLGTLLGLYIP